MAEHTKFEYHLHNAVLRGDLEETKLIIAYLCRLKPWRPGNDLLCAALVHQHLDIARLLLSQGSEVIGDRRNYGGYTALHLAVLYGDSSIVNTILKKGAFYDSINLEGMIPLHLVVYRNNDGFGRFLPPEVNDEESAIILDIFLQCGSNIDTPVTADVRNRYTALHLASECGNENIVPILLDRNADPNAKDCRLLTPLHVASIFGHVGIVKKLLDYGAIPFLKDIKGKTSLRWAMEKRHIEIVELIINYELPRSQRSYNGIPKLSDDKFILISAIQLDSVAIVQSLLHKGVFVQSAWGNGETALHVAVRRGIEAIVKLLLDYGANIRAVAKDGKTPFYLAVETGRLNIVNILLNRVSPTDSGLFLTGQSKLTPLHVAVMSDNEEMVRLLLQRGTQIYRQILLNKSQEKMSESLLHIAVKNGSLPICKLLLEHGADIDAKDDKERNALYFAAERGNLELVNELCDLSLKQKPMEKTWTEGFAALCVAAYDGNDQIVKLILEKGVDVNATLEGYLAPLYVATERNYEKVVKALLEHGFDPNGRKSSVQDGRTSLHCAVVKGFYTIAEYLLQNGADVNAKITEKKKAGYTPLHCAVEADKAYIVMLLLQNGADVNAQTDANHTPIFLAILRNQIDIVQCLIDHGGDVNLPGNKNAEIKDLLCDHCMDSNVLFTSIRPLVLAVLCRNKDIVEILLKSGTPVEMENETPPLHFAAETDHNCEIIEKLLQSGAEINSKCALGHTPLFHAVHAGQIKTIEYLIRNGAHIHMKSKKGNGLLHIAIKSHNANNRLIKLLLECGLNIKARNQLQETPLHCCIYSLVASSGTSLFQFVLDYGAEVNARDVLGNTPLHVAVSNLDEGSINVLLEYGADVNAVNEAGKTAIESNSKLLDIMTVVSKYQNIPKSIIRMIVIRKATGLYINEKNLQFIKSDDILQNYYETCLKEFTSATSQEVYTGVRFSDILSKNMNKLDVYFRNAAIINNLEFTNFTTLFPNYAPVFNSRIQKAKERKLLLESSGELLKSILNFEFPTLIVQHILSFLSTPDLKNMARLFQHPPSFMPNLQTI